MMRPADQNLKLVLGLLLAVKAATFGLIFLGFQTLPFCEICRASNFVYPADSPTHLAVAYQTWDAQHYLYLADAGYKPDQPSNAFYPLFPLLIRWARPLFGGSAFFSGLALATFCSMGAVSLFYLLAKKQTGPETALNATLLLLAFPTAYYLHLIYTEALFLLLAVAAFYALAEDKLAWAALAAFCLPLTRAVGLLVAAPLLWQIFARRAGSHSKLKQAAIVSVAFGAGFVLYLALMQAHTGSLFAGVEAQQYFFSNYTLKNLLNPVGWLARNFVTVQLSVHNFNTSFINRAFFVLFLPTLYLIFKKNGPTFLLYALVAGLVPALSGDLDSFPRYALVVFPMFIALAGVLRQRTVYAILPMMVLQLVFLFAHSLNYWVA